MTHFQRWGKNQYTIWNDTGFSHAEKLKSEIIGAGIFVDFSVVSFYMSTLK